MTLLMKMPMLASRLMLLLGVSALAGCGKSGSAAAEAPPPAVYGAAPARPAQASDAGPSQAVANAAIGTQTLDYPDELQMVLLADRLAGQTPPLDDWAGTAREVQSADEFSRQQKQAAERQRLDAIAASVAGVGRVRLKTSSSLSEYDSGRGGFYLDAFQPGLTYTFKAYDQSVSLRLGNASAAYLWALDPSAAKAVLTRLGARAVNVDMTVELTGASARASGLQIDGRIRDYRLISDRYGSGGQIAEITLK